MLKYGHRISSAVSQLIISVEKIHKNSRVPLRKQFATTSCFRSRYLFSMSNLTFFCVTLFPEADPCSTSPCNNGGACTKISNTKFSCACTPGWIGSDCGQGSFRFTHVIQVVVHSRTCIYNTWNVFYV